MTEGWARGTWWQELRSGTVPAICAPQEKATEAHALGEGEVLSVASRRDADSNYPCKVTTCLTLG